MTIKDIFVDYSNETTAHALHQIFDNERRIWARIFWTLVFVACSCVVAYQLSILVNNFTSFPTIVSTTLGFQQLQFPAVTFCNYNPLKRSKINETSEIGIYLSIYEKFLKIKKQQDLKEICNSSAKKSSVAWALACTNNPLIETKSFDSTTNYAKFTYLQMQNKAQTDVGLLLSLEKKKEYAKAYYEMAELVESCSYNMMACKKTDFAILNHWYYGTCYTFNNNSLHVASKSGSIYGLKVLMDVKADEYLLSADVVGAKVSVHNASTVPLPELDGISVSPGFRTSIGIVQLQTKRLSQPYGNCSEKTVNVEQCLMSCTKKQVWDICLCVWFGYGMENMCVTPEQQACGSSALANVSAHLTMEKCGCRPSCQETAFKLTVSQNLFPATALLNVRCTAEENVVNESCVEMGKSSWLEFEIYYEKLNYQVYEELAAYQLTNLFSDIGGSIGLWLGASVCTVGEFLTLLISVVAYCLCLTDRNIEKKSRPVNPARDTVIKC